jgi:hypothetical protein
MSQSTHCSLFNRSRSSFSFSFSRSGENDYDNEHENKPDWGYFGCACSGRMDAGYPTSAKDLAAARVNGSDFHADRATSQESRRDVFNSRSARVGVTLFQAL